LGNSENPGLASESPTELNFCHQPGLPVPVGLIHQENYCLSAQYQDCPVFLESVQRAEMRRLTELSNQPEPITAQHWTDDTASIFVPVGMELATGAADIPTADIFDWATKDTPDLEIFDPNVHVKIVPRRHRRRNGRNLLIIALVLMGLVAIGWGAWLIFLSNTGGADPITNRLSRMPTMAPTANPVLLDTTGESGVEPLIPISTVQSTEPPPNQSIDNNRTEEADPDAIALTASALFPGGTPVNCSPPSWWVRYIIQPGDTLKSLALSRGVTEAEVVEANCLPSGSLDAVALIYLPPLGIIGTASITATPIPVPAISNTPRPIQPTIPSIQVPTSPPFIIPPIITTEPIIIISTQAPPVVPTSQPPPAPTSPPPRPTNPPQPTAPAAPTPTSGPPPTATPPPLP
jgi:hypothetical protein